MTETSPVILETPSGKDADYENFPVGSWLLPAALRPHIATFYRFARAIDDIADHPETQSDEKIDNLTAFESVLNGEDDVSAELNTARLMRDSLSESNVSRQHCLDLIAAFKQDSVKNRYQSWDDLMGYCLLSAAPVGRYLIDLHGGSDNGYGPSDALCNALQVINHLQDCQDDFRTLNRVYLPEDWLASENVTVDELDDRQCSKGMRQVLDRCLLATEELMQEARFLPGGVYSTRLAMESAVIIRIANRLVKKLKQQDPLAGRVKLSKAEYLLSCLQGVFDVLLGGKNR